MISVELVVAHYGESLAWLRKTPGSLRRTVLDKNPDMAFPDAIALPNIGREAHSYLHFLVSRYDSLSDVTVFCQGHPFDHAFDFHTTLRQIVQSPETVNDFLWLGHIIDTDDARGHTLFRGWSKNEDGHELDMNGFHRALFGIEGPAEYTFKLGAQFAVTQTLVRSRPLDFWKQAREVAMNFPDAAHCFERTWDRVFGVQGIDRGWLGGQKTVYLKPIRRLSAD
ncbi:hypothetical protein IAD21_01491 [Abditibacteriota bacterium]|nr:hypothetical protein IAD21_01491 [Abditibacteriota bacterium]